MSCPSDLLLTMGCVYCTQENYVPSGDANLEGVEASFDVILALSLTKWIHLNWGDVGIKRSFRKMYKQLKPGGALILEMQEWDTYKRRKNLTVCVCVCARVLTMCLAYCIVLHSIC